MGVDCVDVNNVVHYGPSNDVETYIQQTGRSGRKGKITYYQLLIAKDQMRFCNQNIKMYCKNLSICRRDSLYSEFSSYTNHGYKCTCCDICVQRCQCAQCIDLLKQLH